jgi:hypothetical protein
MRLVAAKNGHCCRVVPAAIGWLARHPRTQKNLTEKNLAGYRRAQQDEGQIRRGDVSYVDTKKASELLGRSGLQLPRVPSLNTDHINLN